MPSQGMSKIAISHAVVLVAERRWRTMRETTTSVIATPAIIDKCETITEISVRFVKLNLRLLNMTRSLRRACQCPANVMSVLADVQFSRRDDEISQCRYCAAESATGVSHNFVPGALNRLRANTQARILSNLGPEGHLLTY